jgi:hypothetical protein
MKNKILSYVLGWSFAVLLGLSFWYANADCADQCKNTSNATEYTTCMAGCNQQITQEDLDQWVVVVWDAKCKWIKLNTNFPIIWNCIWTSKDSETNPTTAFPKMIWALTKIIMSLILVVCFIFIIVAGIMWAWSWEDNSQVTKAKWILKKVAIVILLLWFSWAILRLINPNFFG